MGIASRRAIGRTLVCVALAVASMTVGSPQAGAVEIGDPAPDFTLASTSGGDISLRDFRGKKWVLLEFYGSDFAPT